MGRTSIPCSSETRDSVKELKEAADGWQSYDDLLEEMANSYRKEIEGN